MVIISKMFHHFKAIHSWHDCGKLLLTKVVCDMSLRHVYIYPEVIYQYPCLKGNLSQVTNSIKEKSIYLRNEEIV